MNESNCFELPECDGNGHFICIRNHETASTWTRSLGSVRYLIRYVAIRRQNVCWCAPRFGSDGVDIPEETQFLMGRLRDDSYVAFTPLIDGQFRGVLSGSEKGDLLISVQSGDQLIMASEVDALHVIRGKNPYVLLERAAAEIAARLKSVRTRGSKTLPAFIDYFGFCTWNAFYNHITHEKLAGALKVFHEGGIRPGFVIMDAGWQPYEEDFLTDFEADPVKFPHGLAAAVHEMKEHLGVSHVLAWMAYNGYWRGVHPEKMARYHSRLQIIGGTGDVPEVAAEDVATVGRNFLPDHVNSRGVASPEPDFLRFYADYFEFLARSGVDGVKIDAMTWVEAFGEGKGGRVTIMGDLLSAVESQSLRYWNGSYLACSSCSNDFLLQMLSTSLVRTSADFYPEIPASHGTHLVNNAFVSLWMGPYCLPDWDMFQSAHEAGPFHAAARVLSGGPVYVADEVGKSDFALLRRLAFTDGSLARCLAPALPCRDTLLRDPVHEDWALKLFNRNATGFVLGFFHCRWEGGIEVLPVPWMPEDAEMKVEEIVAVWSEAKQVLDTISSGECRTAYLSIGEYEILTLCPSRGNVAPIGCVNLLNPGAAIVSWNVEAGLHKIVLRGDGVFVAWCATKPIRVCVEGESKKFDYTPNNGCLRVSLDPAISRLRNIDIEIR